YSSGGGTAVGQLQDGQTYFVILTADPNRIKLADSLANAQAGIALDLTPGTGSGHTIREVGASSPSINNADVTDPGLVSRRVATPHQVAVKGVAVTAVNTDDIEHMVISGAGDLYFNVPIAASVNVTSTHTKAYIDDNAEVNQTRTGSGAGQSVLV